MNKKLLVLLTTLLIGISCEHAVNPVIEEKEDTDVAPAISVSLVDLEYDEDRLTTDTISVSGIFTDADNDTITYGLYSNSNPDIVTVKIKTEKMIVTVIPNKNGVSEIKLIGRSNNKFVLSNTFKITISRSPAKNEMLAGNEALLAKDFSSAKTHYLISIEKNDNRYLSKAKLGFGLSTILDNASTDADFDSAIENLKSALELDESLSDAYYGLGVVYHSYKGESQLALSYFDKVKDEETLTLAPYITKSHIGLARIVAMFDLGEFDEVISETLDLYKDVFNTDITLSRADSDWRSRLDTYLSDLRTKLKI